MTDTLLKSLDGQDFSAYISMPASKNGPGLIVIQEIFGVNATMRAICDDFAAQGYVAVCPDMFWRLEPNVQINDADPQDWNKAFDLYKRFDTEAGVRDLLATLAFLRRFQGCSGMVGVVGYSLGGKLAYLMGARSDVECSVSYYGMGIESLMDEVSDIRMPMLLHMPEHDKFVPPPTRQRILFNTARNPVIKAEVYQGCDHAFARASSPNYNAQATVQANEQTKHFLAEFLRDKVRG